MKEEYNYTLTLPLTKVKDAQELLEGLQQDNPALRLSRKPDTRVNARFYLCFSFSGLRTDLQFLKWFEENKKEGWEVFGPNYGVWGLK